MPQPPRPSGRPRVAGLRKPASPSPAPREQDTDRFDDATQVTDVGSDPTAVPAPEPTDPPPVDQEPPPEPEAELETEAEDDDEPKAAKPRPGPRRKVRDTGTPKPASQDDVTATVSAVEPSRARRFPVRGAGDRKTKGHKGNRGYALVAVLLVLALAFGGLAFFFNMRQSEAETAAGNAALVDVQGTTQVKEAMGTAAERLFSIDYNDIGKTEQAADQLLVNDEVKKKYQALMGEVKRVAPEQKIVVTVKTTRSAVLMLNDDRAKVMVYIDQTATRTEDNQTSAGSAALWFTSEKRDGEWKVTDMDTYAAGQPAPTPGPAGQGGQPPAGN
ncbi:hypothetical protein [Prauserella marina]|nr:hypothetical protein [Prauserella marina]